MKVEKKESAACVVAVTVKADAEEVKGDYQKVLNAFTREAVIPGFRKGKVPLAILKQKFQSEILQECQQRCFNTYYPKAVEEAGLKDAFVNLQNVTDVIFTAETGFSCVLHIEVKPKFDLPKYRKLAIKGADTEVTDEQVEKDVEMLRTSLAKFEDAKAEDAIAEGDYAEIDYKGATDDKAAQPLSEIVPDQKVICEGTGFWTQVIEGHFVPEILDALKGMKAGETKSVKVKFPKDAAPEPLKGKKCVYEVTVKSFRRRVLPDDAALLEGAKAESMDALRQQARARLEADAKKRDEDARREQAIELLLKKADFDVPPSLVQRQTESFLNDLARRAQYMGMTAEYIEQNRDKILADAHNNAIRQVRLSYILLGIAKDAEIEISDADVTAALEKMAAGSNGKTTADDLRKQLEEHDQVELYKDQLRAEKALELVMAEAKK